MLFTIKGPNDVADFVRSVLTDNSREHCVALYLDGAHQVVSYSIISIGTANMSVVHPREVFQRAILAGAISIIIAHNHPSGVLTPSDEDHKVTQRLKDAGEILGIKLLDHLILPGPFQKWPLVFFPKSFDLIPQEMGSQSQADESGSILFQSRSHIFRLLPKICSCVASFFKFTLLSV
jgi:hypothetical protein